MLATPAAKLFDRMREQPGKRMVPPEEVPNLPLMYGLAVDDGHEALKGIDHAAKPQSVRSSTIANPCPTPMHMVHSA